MEHKSAMFDTLSENAVRLLVFISVFAAMGVFELVRPRRRLLYPKAQRWLTNLTIIVIGSAVVRVMAMLVVPIAAVAAAGYAEEHGIGLLNWLTLPDWIEAIFAIVVLDFAIWAQHVASHKVPMLWRLHQMHHADPDIDVSTGIRFHPIEIAMSMLWKIVVVLVLGASPVAVFLFEVILNASALFSHANVRLPEWLDRVLRTIVVTPDMHRAHHSVLRHEHDSNYGFNFSIWDRACGTYTQEPEKGHENMTIGLAPYQSERPTRLTWSLLLPFQNQPRRD
jgi:sterol desaturase/sphingolipid hydroxylase (fatty acid hydroxylase superfamily)